MQVREIMTLSPVCCSAATSLPEVAQMMLENDCGAIPVVADDEQKSLVGVITDRDIVCRTLAQRRDPLPLLAEDCMSTPVVTVAPETEVAECARLMREHQIRRILVVGPDGTCQGIVAQADLAHFCPPQETGRVVQAVST